jgi:tRNA(His) guanylyltransferase
VTVDNPTDSEVEAFLDANMAKPRGDALGDRMKSGYEAASRSMLPWRMPLIIRVDGKAFHSWTRGLEPFCHDFADAMNGAAIALCKEISGAQLAYIQSDEISVLVHGYKRLKSEPWFQNDIQKIVSVSASIAAGCLSIASADLFGEPKRAAFDSRAFVLPEAEVVNAFLWRQQDATRNSIQSLARTKFSATQCFGKSCSELQEMLHKAGTNWNDLPTSFKRGRCVVKETYQVGEQTRSRWVVDSEIPVFSQDREYIGRLLAVEET